ncbi:MAG: cell division protein FtsL [Deltaproteobacteria bacterium]|nr:cell division protein FtsL [Deltaproteobacteria bacterium]
MTAPPPTTPPLPKWATSVTVFALITGALLFVAWAKMETVQITYAIDELMDEEAALAEEQRRLRTELAELRSPRKLEVLAPDLGLEPPEPGQVIVVGDESVDAALPEDPASASDLPDSPDEGAR